MLTKKSIINDLSKLREVATLERGEYTDYLLYIQKLLEKYNPNEPMTEEKFLRNVLTVFAELKEKEAAI